MIKTQPQNHQLLGQPMFEHVIIQMLDQNGNPMDQVGYVNNPYEVRVDIFEPQLDDQSSDRPAIDGTTVVQFAAGTGEAVFDNIILKGGLKSTKLRFRLIKPTDSSIVAIETHVIRLLPGIGGTGKSEGTCNADKEGVRFGKIIATNSECNFACLQSCLNSIQAPECGPAQCGPDSYSVCTKSNGCECDGAAIPDLSTLSRNDYITGTTCTKNRMEIRLNKCLLNKAGLKLNQLYLNGPDVDFETFDSLGTSEHNNCRGKLAYTNGPEYVFTINTQLTDCKTQQDGNTYKNAVQGFIDDVTERTTKRSKFLIDFTCQF